jgi:hypothetical protein
VAVHPHLKDGKVVCATETIKGALAIDDPKIVPFTKNGHGKKPPGQPTSPAPTRTRAQPKADSYAIFERLRQALRDGGYAERRANTDRYRCPACEAPGDGHGLRITHVPNPAPGERHILLVCDSQKCPPEEILEPLGMTVADICAADDVNDLGEEPDDGPSETFLGPDEAALVNALRRERARREALRILDGEAINLDALPPPRTLRESLDNPPPGATVRIEELTIAGGRTTVVGARKAGKTTFLANLIRSLLSGSPFLDRYPVQKTVDLVYVLSYEMSEWQFTEWLADQGLAEYGDRIITWHLRGQPNPLRTDKGRALVAQRLAGAGAGALIVDTFTRAFYGRSQNDPGEVSQWQNDLDEVAGPDRDVFVTVHAGWTAERSRGASSLEDWPDTILTLVEYEKTRYLSVRGRDVDDIDEVPLAYDPDTRSLRLDPLKPPRTVAKAERRNADKRAAEEAKAAKARRERNRVVMEVLEVMRRNPGLGVNEIKDKVPGELRGVKVNEALKHARDWHLAEVKPGPNSKKCHHITDAGLAALEVGELPANLNESGDSQ